MLRILKQNRKKLILFGLIILVFTLFLVYNTIKPPTRSEKIYDQNSILLKFLDCDHGTPAESGWSWNSLYIIQEKRSPSLENGYIIEQASCILDGTYNHNWITNSGTMLFYGVKKYSKLANLTPDSVKTEDFIGVSSFSPKFLKLGKNMHVNCLLDRNSWFSCHLAIQYNYVSTYVRLVGRQTIDIANIQDFINRLLSRLNDSIETIDHQ